MPVYEPFFKRRQRERGAFSDVFQTETLPKKLRLQLFQIYKDVTGDSGDFTTGTITKHLFSVMQREAPEIYHGMTVTNFMRRVFLEDNLPNYNDEHVLSVMELALNLTSEFSFNFQGRLVWRNQYVARPEMQLNEAINETNVRMRENGYGYQFESGIFIPIDSTFTHAEAVKPALVLLNSADFQGALDEFLEAFDAYKQQNYDECIRLCGNSLESTLKQIISERGWTLPKSPTAAPLFEVLTANGLIQPYLTTHYTSLFSMLKSGVPTIRNNSGGHGQGTQVREVPDYLARFVINMTASSILFLIHAHQDVSAAP